MYDVCLRAMKPTVAGRSSLVVPVSDPCPIKDVEPGWNYREFGCVWSRKCTPNFKDKLTRMNMTIKQGCCADINRELYAFLGTRGLWQFGHITILDTGLLPQTLNHILFGTALKSWWLIENTGHFHPERLRVPKSTADLRTLAAGNKSWRLYALI